MTHHPVNEFDQSQFVRIAVSRQSDADAALAEIAEQLAGVALGFVMLFLPERCDPKLTANAIEAHLSNYLVFGASSAGQITPQGYDDSAFLAIGFPKAHFRVASVLLTPLHPFSLEEISGRVTETERRFARTAQWNRLAILICDGLSKQEDVLVASLSVSLPDIPVFGGSAAENSTGKKTLIYKNGEFTDNAALLLLVETDLDYTTVNFDHFVPTGKKMVVTRALPDERIVQELNGVPAAREYARIIGVEEKDLSAELFAQFPVLIKEGARYHVRSIQKITDDGGLSLLCAIDAGLVLTLGEGDAIIRKLEKELSQTLLDDRQPAFILGFDCFLRRLEIEQRQRVERASAVLSRYRVVGFNTFGEQHSGIHVNQTFVGIAFYERTSFPFHD